MLKAYDLWALAVDEMGPALLVLFLPYVAAWLESLKLCFQRALVLHKIVDSHQQFTPTKDPEVLV